jgi:hypothetical protein
LQGSSEGEGPVDLATFAAVSAGIAEGFDEEEVLAHHEVPPGTWLTAKTTWTRKLVDEGQDGPLFGDYRVALHRREDELGREVDPIDRELDPWLSFVAATQAEDPAALFTRTGLRLPDLSRLSRAWSARLDADPDLKARAEERRAAGVTPEVPPLKLGKSSLFGRSPPPPEKLPEGRFATGDFEAFEEVSVADYVAIMARIERPENLLLSVLRTRLIHPKTWERERARIESAMQGDPVFRREVSVLMSFERSRLDVARAQRTDSRPPPPPPTLDDVWGGGELPASILAPQGIPQFTPSHAMPAVPQHTPSHAMPAVPQHTPSYALPAAPHHTPSYALPAVPQHTPSYAMPAAPHHTPSYALPAVPQHTPSHAMPAAPAVPQHTPSHALPAVGHHPPSVPPPPETPYVDYAPPSGPVYSFQEVRAEAYAYEPPAEPWAEQFQDEGTSAVDLDEATSFQLPFALPDEPALPFAVVAEPVANAAADQPFDDDLPISLEDHARLHVELNAGFAEAEVLARYGLPWDARPRADTMIEDWKRRDPRAAETWAAAYQQHVNRLLDEDGADA